MMRCVVVLLLLLLVSFTSGALSRSDPEVESKTRLDFGEVIHSNFDILKGSLNSIGRSTRNMLSF